MIQIRLLAAITLLIYIGTAFADMPLPDITMQPVAVSEHVYVVEGMPGIATDNAGFVSNATFVVTGDGVVVFDTLGSPALAMLLHKAILKTTDQSIRRVYISHYHADHFYGAQIFADMGAEIIAPSGAADYLASDVSRERLHERRVSLSPWVNENTRLVVPDRYLEGEERFTLGDVSFRALDMGSAHSDGDLVLLVETDRVMLSGDIIFEGRIPLLGSNNTDLWLATLNELVDVDVAAIVPGHGHFSTNADELVALTRDYLQFMRRVMGEAVENWIPFDEAYDAVDWSDFIELPAFTEANRSNAYGVYLSIERESLK